MIDNRTMLFELDDVSLARGRQAGPARAHRHASPTGATCLAGPSGSGKSTLLRLLNRLADPESRDGPLPRRRRPRARPARAAPRGLPGASASGAARGHASTTTSRFAAELAGREPDVGRAARSSPGSTPASPTATARGSRSASSSGRCSLERSRSSRRVLLLDEPTSALDAEPPRRDRGDPARAARAAGDLDSSSSPTTSTRRGGWRTGSCASRPGRQRRRGPDRRAAERGLGLMGTTRDRRQPRRGRREPRSLVAIAIAVSRLAADRARGRHRASRSIRSIIQLIAIGYVIQAIFDEDSSALVIGAARGDGRLRRLHRSGAGEAGAGRLWPLLIALTLAAVVDARPGRRRSASSSPTPRYLVPVGGMVIGNAMTAAAVALNRLGDEIDRPRPRDRGDPGARRDLDPGRRRRAFAAACARA